MAFIYKKFPKLNSIIFKNHLIIRKKIAYKLVMRQSEICIAYHL